MNNYIPLGFLKTTARELCEDTDNVEYVRGICELIAYWDGIPEVDMGARAVEIAAEIGVEQSVINKMY